MLEPLREAPTLSVRRRVAELINTEGARWIGGAVLFTVLTIALTFPVATNIGSRTLGGFNDATSQIRDYWAIERDGSNPFTSTHDPLIAAPEGRARTPAVQVAAPLQSTFVWVLKDVIGLTAALNLFVLMGFALTGFFGFLAIERAGLGLLPAFVAGYVAAFNPWMMEKAYSGHVSLVHAWVLIVLFLALMRLLRMRTIGAAALAGAAYGMSFLVASYMGFLATAIVAAFVVVDLIQTRSLSDRLWTLTLTSVIGAVTVLALLPGLVSFLLERDETIGNLSRSLDSVKRFSASLTSYLTPSSRHPLFGDWAAGIRVSDPLNEKVLFFGYTTIVLAAASVVLLIRKRKQAESVFPQRRLVALAAVTVVIAFYASLAPDLDIFGLPVPTPSTFLSEVTTFYRVYARFGIVVGVALALLAATAIAHLSRLRHGTAFSVALAAVIVFELLPGSIPSARIDRAPAHDAWLARQPAGIVVHFPYSADKVPAQLRAGREFYYQRFAGQPIFNDWGAAPGTRSNAIRVASRNVASGEARRILATMGVRYLVIHRDVYRMQGEKPPRIRHGAELLIRFEDIEIYRLTARPLDLDALLEKKGASIREQWGQKPVSFRVREAGFHAGEPFDPSTGPWHWLIQGGIAIIVNSNDGPVRLTLELKGFSNMKTRTLSVLDDEGRVLETAVVPTYLVEMKLGPFIIEPGTMRFHFAAKPGPEPLGDGRHASIYLSPILPNTLAYWPPAS